MNASVVVLILANLIPLAGVLFWDWSVFEVVVLYWLENVIIGGINILKMLTCAPDPGKFDLQGRQKRQAVERGWKPGGEEAEKAREFVGMIETHGDKLRMLHHGSKLFIIPFFAIHYGIFCLVHGSFVFALLGGREGRAGIPISGPGPGGVLEFISAGGILGLVALAGSHLFSFFFNYLGKGEFRQTAVPLLMIAPYGRIVVLHIAILFGAFATMMLGSPLFLLVLLVVGKIILDWTFHQRAHRKAATRSASPSL
jgi:hypothetical protein